MNLSELTIFLQGFENLVGVLYSKIHTYKVKKDLAGLETKSKKLKFPVFIRTIVKDANQIQVF